MELRDALSQISEIRQQLSRGEVFRGYRSATAAFSALAAIAAALVQSSVVADPARDTGPYLKLWIAVAVISVVAVGVEMFIRCRKSGSHLQAEMTMLAVEQFLPSVIAGGLLTLVMWKFAVNSLWMLPGLWAMLLSLAIFASRRVLPPQIFIVGAYYLIASVVCLALGQSEYAFSPWTMGLTFGIGQLLAAGVLYWTLERSPIQNESHVAE